MTKFETAAEKASPLVVLDPQNHHYLIAGQSYPENAREFYQPVVEWFKEFLATSESDLRLTVKLLYLNTSSMGVFMYLFLLLEEAAKKGRVITVDWYYDLENESAKDVGEEFQEIVTFPFTVLAEPDRPS